MTVRFASGVHVNVSGAFFRTLNDTLRSVQGNSTAHDDVENYEVHRNAIVLVPCVLYF